MPQSLEFKHRYRLFNFSLVPRAGIQPVHLILACTKAEDSATCKCKFLLHSQVFPIFVDTELEDKVNTSPWNPSLYIFRFVFQPAGFFAFIEPPKGRKETTQL